ncbi:Hypothetical_protein [Hexamita inflata]|uniref:Hypothetical_protein n=1 Tax=Hexamita inflata TaxID=28002 RepID=A0AA86PTG0_9EUKA|nr:Hypothetical protein HINF_LOCUS33665 [Hexamita inflata]
MRLGQIGCERQNPPVQSAELPSRIGMAKGMPSTSLQDWKAATAPLLPQKRRWYDAGGFPYRSARMKQPRYAPGCLYPSRCLPWLRRCAQRTQVYLKLMIIRVNLQFLYRRPNQYKRKLSEWDIYIYILQSQFDTAAAVMRKFKETKKKHDDKKITQKTNNAEAQPENEKKKTKVSQKAEPTKNIEEKAPDKTKLKDAQKQKEKKPPVQKSQDQKTTKMPQSSAKSPQKETQKKKKDKQPVLEKPVEQPKVGPNEQKTITDAKQETKPILTKAQKKKLQMEYQKQQLFQIVYLGVVFQRDLYAIFLLYAEYESRTTNLLFVRKYYVCTQNEQYIQIFQDIHEISINQLRN